MTNGIASMLAGTASVKDALAAAQQEADAAIDDYNSRIGS